MGKICPALRAPTPVMRGSASIAIGLIVVSMGFAGPPVAVAQSLSIDAWLRSERGNPNLARSLQAYEAAQVTPTYPVESRPQGGTLPQRVYRSDTTHMPDIEIARSPEFDERRIREYAAGADTSSSGFYIAGHLGNAFVMEEDYEADFATLTPSFDPLSLYGSGAVGVDLGSGLSLEAELSYQSADINKLTVTGAGAFSGISVSTEDVEGSVSALSLMANGAYAFGDRSGISPYVMGGVGLSRISLNGLDEKGGSDPTDDAAFAFAWQLGAGISTPLTSNTSFDVGYRYFNTLDADMEDDGVSFTAGFSSHTVLFGLKHRL